MAIAATAPASFPALLCRSQGVRYTLHDSILKKGILALPLPREATHVRCLARAAAGPELCSGGRPAEYGWAGLAGWRNPSHGTCASLPRRSSLQKSTPPRQGGSSWAVPTPGLDEDFLRAEAGLCRYEARKLAAAAGPGIGWPCPPARRWRPSRRSTPHQPSISSRRIASWPGSPTYRSIRTGRAVGPGEDGRTAAWNSPGLIPASPSRSSTPGCCRRTGICAV